MPTAAVLTWSPSAEKPQLVHCLRRPPSPWVRTSGPGGSCKRCKRGANVWPLRQGTGNIRDSRDRRPERESLGTVLRGRGRAVAPGWVPPVPAQGPWGPSLLVWKDCQALGSRFRWRALALSNLDAKWQELCGQPELHRVQHKTFLVTNPPGTVSVSSSDPLAVSIHAKQDLFAIPPDTVAQKSTFWDVVGHAFNHDLREAEEGGAG